MKRLTYFFSLLMVCLFANAQGTGIYRGESAYAWLYFVDPVTQNTETVYVSAYEQGYAVKTTRQLFLAFTWTSMSQNWEVVRYDQYYCQVDPAIFETGQSGASIAQITLSDANCAVSGYSDSRGAYIPPATSLLVQWFDPDETGVSTTVSRGVNTVTKTVSSDTVRLGYGAGATVVLVNDSSAYTFHPAGGYSFATDR